MAMPFANRSAEAKASSQTTAAAKGAPPRFSAMSTLSSSSAAPSRLTDSTAASRRKASSTLSKAAARSAAMPKPPSPVKMAPPPPRTLSKVPTTSPAKKPLSINTSDNEAIKAFLRIRPAPEETAKTEEEPYIEVISETEVLMSPPKSSTAARARVYSTAIPTKYAFSKVFASHLSKAVNSQASFYKETALPLVEELMQGQSGLIFTYGVTNSGKSYTVQGGLASSEAGILPRSMDTIFNSIKGLESSSDIRPVGLSGVELANGESANMDGLNPFSLPGLSKKLSAAATRPAQYEHDATKVRVDRNYRYSVWVSYVEVYNEKIFDLLDAAPPSTSATPRASTFGGGMSRSDSYRGSNWSLAPLAADSGPIYLQRRPLTLKNDVESGGKYVAGLQEIRVQSAAEARELLQRGQENRQVFGTMANRASSRSHGVFTVKVIREHAGEKDLTVAFSTSRLSIVDLAGSERLGNTSVTGDRLKEAGNINKSLMCLGQCLETLRKNQARAASFVPMPSPVSSLAGSTINAAASRMLKRRPSIVPFRHSKLTELFQSFFTGEGRAVMIVNVNPFDTGFDENSHVMRFSAAAKEVQTVRNSQTTATSLSRFVHPSLRDLFNPSASPAPSPAGKTPVILPKAPVSASVSTAAPVSASAAAAASRVASAPLKKSSGQQPVTPSRQSSMAKAAPIVESSGQEVTIIEENDEEDDDESDSFVDHLMANYEEVRHRLYESEKQCAEIEARVRQEMAQEMSKRLQEMESIFNSRILQDSSLHDDFINRKLDLLGSSSRNSRRRQREQDSDEDDDDDDLEVEESLANYRTLPATDSGEDQTMTSQEQDEEEDSSEEEEEEGGEAEESILVTVPKKKSGAKRMVSEEDSSVDDIKRKGSLQNANDSLKGADTTVDEFYSSEGAEEDDSDGEGESDDDDQEQQEDGDDGSEEEAEEEANSDSDVSFDVSEESVESSFEAAPKRTSRGRASKPIAPAPAASSRAKQQSAKPVVNRKKPVAASRKSTNGLPLMERPANVSMDIDQSSDASLVIPEKTKSPKKRK